MRVARPNYEQRFEQTLRRIAAYDSPARLRRDSEKAWGLGFEEAMEMAYENIQCEARAALKGYRKPRAVATSGDSTLGGSPKQPKSERADQGEG